jgi:hypothetical protein
MNITRAAVCLGVLACSPAFASDVYRCDLKDGRTVYQGAQCEIGTQETAIDARNARREQVKKSLEQERQLKRQKTAQATSS